MKLSTRIQRFLFVLTSALESKVIVEFGAKSLINERGAVLQGNIDGDCLVKDVAISVITFRAIGDSVTFKRSRDSIMRYIAVLSTDSASNPESTESPRLKE